MFFFHTEGGMRYVALEPSGEGFICMGTFDNLGTEEAPVYYFDGRYTDHMIETSMMDPVYEWRKHTSTQAKRFARKYRLCEVDVYSFEQTHWIVRR